MENIQYFGVAYRLKLQSPLQVSLFAMKMVSINCSETSATVSTDYLLLLVSVLCDSLVPPNKCLSDALIGSYRNTWCHNTEQNVAIYKDVVVS